MEQQDVVIIGGGVAGLAAAVQLGRVRRSVVVVDAGVPRNAAAAHLHSYLGFETRVDNIARSDLYIADELFVCGTAAEISSVNSVDDRSIPCPGPMTKAIADVYTRAVRGEEGKYKDWCELV